MQFCQIIKLSGSVLLTMSVVCHLTEENKVESQSFVSIALPDYEQRLFILQNASSEWNFGGRCIIIQDPRVVQRVEIINIYTSSKNNGSFRPNLLAKLFVVKDIHSIVIRGCGLFGWIRFLIDHQGMHLTSWHGTIFTHVSHDTA